MEYSFTDPENSSHESLLNGIPMKRVANLRAAESFIATKGYAKVPQHLEKEYTRHWSASECPPEKLKWATRGLVKISQRGGTGGESDSTTYMIKPLLSLQFPHGNGKNNWLLVKVAQPASVGSVRDGQNKANKPLTLCHSTQSQYEPSNAYMEYTSPKGGRKGKQSNRGKAGHESALDPSHGEPLEEKGGSKEIGCNKKERVLEVEDWSPGLLNTQKSKKDKKEKEKGPKVAGFTSTAEASSEQSKSTGCEARPHGWTKVPDGGLRGGNHTSDSDEDGDDNSQKRTSTHSSPKVHEKGVSENAIDPSVGETNVDMGPLEHNSEKKEQEAENCDKDDPDLNYAKRPDGWATVAEEATSQRPLPLAEPRIPDLEYFNMTVDAIQDEGGIEVTSPQKDQYRRSNAQVEAIKAAREDQRSIGGGVYQCLRDDLKDHFLTIHRAFAAKTIGIVVVQIEESTKKKRPISHSFFKMEYEDIKIKDGQRFRKAQPVETHTGFMWRGYGGDQYPLPSTCVYSVCERAGDRDLHFSEKGCGRLTEAPGASQGICANNDCGVVAWHFNRKRFDRPKHRVTYKEKWEDDFSIVVYKDGTQKLVWRDQSGAQTYWERLDSSNKYSTYKVPPAAQEMVDGIVTRGELPNHDFHDPSFVPSIAPWKEQHPLERVPIDSEWKFVAAVLQGIHLTPGRRLSATVSQWLQFKLKGTKRKDGFMATLSDLLRPNPWSCSLKDLAEMIGCFVDGQEQMFLNTEILLVSLVNRLAWSLDYKVADMARRHETQIVRKIVRQCSHQLSGEDMQTFWATLSLGRFESGNTETLTVAHIQEKLNAKLETKTRTEMCVTCGVETVQHSTRKTCGNDPDFLTLRLGKEAAFDAQDMQLSFGWSTYTVKTVVHWDRERKRSSVSAKRDDGWYLIRISYGVGEEEEKYNEGELLMSLHFHDVAVLMAVRTGSIGDINKSNDDTVSREDQDISKMSANFEDMDISGRKSVSEEPEVIDIETIDDQNDPFSDDDEMMKRAKLESLKTLRPNYQAQMVTAGIEAMAKYGVLCSDPLIYIPMDGNCLFSCYARSMNLSLTGKDLHKEADEKRIFSVGPAIQEMYSLRGDRIDRAHDVIKKVVGPDEEEDALTVEEKREQINDLLEKYLENSKYAGDMGDLLVYIVATFLNVNILIIRLVKEGAFLWPVTPDNDVFKGDKEATQICIVTLQGSHFEHLPLREESRQAATKLLEDIKTGKRSSYVKLTAAAVATGDQQAMEESSQGLAVEEGIDPTPQPDEPLDTDVLSDGIENVSLEQEKVAGSSYVPEVQGGSKRDGRISPTAASTPVKNPPPKRSRLDDTFLSPIKDAGASRSLFSGGPVESQPHQTQTIATQSQELFSQLLSKLDHRLSECICGNRGHIANHLRESPQCVEQLRQTEELQFMQGESDEAFIAKTALLLSSCPAPECPGGDHKGIPLPEVCYQWYRGDGGGAMGFKESISANNRTMKNKINKFLRNTRNRHFQPRNLMESITQHQISQCAEEEGVNMTQATEIPQQILCVKECFYAGSLAGHLLDQPDCCSSMIEKHLVNRSTMYKEKPQLAVFDLAIVLFFCPNPACTIAITHQGNARKDVRAMSGHIRGPCLPFYQNEGVSLLNWPRDLEPDAICTKLNNRRSHLRKSMTKTEEWRMKSYMEEVTKQLEENCRCCLINGPLFGHQQHKLVVVDGTWHNANSKVHECLPCNRREEKQMEMIGNFRANVEDLSNAKPGDTTALVAVEVEHPHTHAKRVVFVPSQLKGELQTVEENIPYNATVVVPNLPEALDQLQEECFDKAHEDKESLREFTDFASRRPIVGSSTLELSVFWRMNQANIKMERISMLKSLSSTCKGEIETRNPNIASIKKRNPTYALTKKFCLVNTCSWSEGAQERRSKERQARSSVNGAVKTKVVLTLLERTGDSPLARAIPFLNYAYGKMRALVKHIIGPSYSNYDLEVRFHASEWKIDLVGFLYSKEYEMMNVEIAREDAEIAGILHEISNQSALMPTVSINAMKLAEKFNLDQERAKTMATLARTHQTGHCSTLQPLSLIDIYTPDGVDDVTDHEMLLRRRAAELGDAFGESVDTSAAISNICQTLMEEGFDHITMDYNTERTQERLAEVPDPVSSEVVKYHCLLLRTGPKGGWTLRRDTGESNVEPYIPLLLEANQWKMSAEVCIQKEQAEDITHDQGLKGLPFHFFKNWKEVSVLEFLNGCMPSSKAPQLKGATSQAMAQIIAQKDEKHTFRPAPGEEEGDGQENMFLSRDGEPYMRTTGDIRVLYELRPMVTDPMPLAQLACEYRILKPNRDKQAYDRALGEIDSTTNVGPDSSTTIAGTLHRAPTSMKLRNGKIMVKRSGAFAVPYLLHSGALNKYSNTLLFNPWRELESIQVDQEDIETAAQRQIRLELFPMSVFPVCKDQIDGDEDDSD